MTTALTKAEIATAVEAVRSLSDLIEKLHKASWPLSSQADDTLRKPTPTPAWIA
jgi:hypothetical protein